MMETVALKCRLHCFTWRCALIVCYSFVLFLNTAGRKEQSSPAAASPEPSPAPSPTQPLLPTCQPADFHYALTECDESGIRWRVQVPKPNACTGGAPAPPVRAVDCGFSCEPGKYLDIDNLDCRLCPEGKYSLGGGAKYTDWSELPSGFSVSSSSLFDDDLDNCNQSNWEAIGYYMRSPDSMCYAKLTYTAKLAKQGSVTFSYSLASDMNYFSVEVHNELCQSKHGNQADSRFIPPTGEGEWRSIKVDLDAGLNVITWSTDSLYFGTAYQIPRAYIRSVEVMGLEYTSDCTKCPPGTFSDQPGASSCAECPENTYSLSGAMNCTGCNTETHFSVPGSSNCTEKKPCTEHDFYRIHTPCQQNKTKIKYKWIKPQLCNPSHKDSVTLPVSGKFQPCPPCNPGMSFSNKTRCEFCPRNTFSDGTTSCQDCPPNTTPDYGMTFSYWNELPPNMVASCFSTTNKYGCASDDGWVLADNYIHTGHGHADSAYLVLDLTVEGFRSQESYYNGKAEELGTISFVFSMECESKDCTMFFIEELSNPNVIEFWTGSTERLEYRYAVTSAGSRTLTWAFQKTSADEHSGYDDKQFANDVVKIYDITITNTLNGGAASCKECPLGSDLKGCVPCKPGQYIDEISKGCKKCPADTYVRGSDPVGKDACLPCGSGLKSDGGKDCYSDCHVHLNGRHYDLQRLQGPKSVMSSASFLMEGSAFYYHLNLSLCGKEQDSLAKCTDNSSAIGQERDGEETSVMSWVCRSVMMPGSDRFMTSIKPISLGDTLLGVNDDNKLGVVNDTIIPQPTEGLRDLKFYYHSKMTTKACPQGRSTIVTLRCDPSEDKTDRIELPAACPSVMPSQDFKTTTVAQAGTCDGCTFHMLWSSKHACPLCTKEDIVAIKQECQKRQQITKFVWNDTVQCVGGVTLPADKTEECVVPQWYTQVPMYAQIAIAAFVGAAILLCAMVVCIWKKNKKLEYKYQKLVSSASGELPAADSCAIQEGEDEDEVHFEDGKKKARSFLSKFKSKSSSDKQGLLDGPDMEAFHMTNQPSIMTPLADST
ncbi:endosome/lysosome-associated apoptosis and autophagy regulator family member 2-like [Diadema setosum]|uniref:endosome/lysosome-associated apoptosis and autophagy regulator family member 2-like n=1 Tax=Diadema setosum TaxID=31175 RepID=UPI003B3B49AA